MLRNLINRVKLMFAPDGAGGGSAEGGVPAAANAEDQLTKAFGGDAGADGVKPDVKPAGGDAAKGGTDTVSENKLPAWTDQLPPEMKGNPEFAAKLGKYSKVGDMAKAFLELETRAASGGVPGKDATAEEVAAFWEKAGRPKAADGYAFANDKTNNGAVFANAAFEANLTAAQAEAMFNSLNQLGAQRMQAAALANEKQVRETAAALETEYGSKYKEKMELLARGLAAAGPNVGKLLSQAGLAGNPEIVKAFISYGEMTAESPAARGGGVGEPLKSITEGGTFEFKS